MNAKQLGIVFTVVIITAATTLYVIRDEAASDHSARAIDTIGTTSTQSVQPQTTLGYTDSTPKRSNTQSDSASFSTETATQDPEKRALPDIASYLSSADPVVKEVANYEIHMMKETRDNQWAQTVEATVDEALHVPALSSLSTVSSECRSTLCRWELASNDEVDAVNAEKVFVGTLAQKDGGSTLIRRIQDPAGSGLRLVVFYARPGYVLPTMEQ